MVPLSFVRVNKIFLFPIWNLLLKIYMKQSIINKVIVFFIVLYRVAISPFVSPCCRFFPTCSSYTIAAIEKYGVLSGGLMAVRRILSCHPFSRKMGHDPLQ